MSFLMARDTNTETTEVITDHRESPLLVRGFSSGVDHHPVIRQERNLQNRNVRKKHFCILKWISLSISAFFVIAGSIGVVATSWALLNTSFLIVVKSSSAGIYLLIVSVVLLFLTGVVGLIAVLRHSRPVLGSLIVLLFVSWMFILVGGVWTYVTATQADKMSLQRVTNIVLNDYGRDPSKTAILDIVQQSFQCCGSENFFSWMTSAYSLNQTENQTGGIKLFTVPKSCCIDPGSRSCQDHLHMERNTTTNHFIYTNGCVKKLQSTFVPYGSYALAASMVVGFLLIVELVVSFTLFRRFSSFFSPSIGRPHIYEH